MPKLSSKERVLEYILSKDINESNEVFLGLNSYKAISDFTPKEFIQQLVLLDDDKLIEAKFTGQRNEGSTSIIKLNSHALTYFEDKKKSKQNKFFNGTIDFIKFLIPTIISALALLVSLFKN